MKRKILIAWFFLLCSGLLSAFAAPPPGAPTVNDEEAWKNLLPTHVNKIKGGKIIVRPSPPQDGVRTYGVVAGFIVDVNIDEAYKILRETDKQSEYTKILEESKNVEITDAYEITEFKVKFLGKLWTYRSRREWDDKKYRIWWTLDKNFDNDFSRFDGYYYCYYMDDTHTLLRYRGDLVFKEFVPLSLQQIVIRQDMPRGLEDVRKRINSHGTYRVGR